MGFDDALNKAKDFAKSNQDKIEETVDSAAEKAQQVAPDQADEHIRKATEGVKDKIQDQLGK